MSVFPWPPDEELQDVVDVAEALLALVRARGHWPQSVDVERCRQLLSYGAERGVFPNLESAIEEFARTLAQGGVEV